jgi:hypothetical protein
MSLHAESIAAWARLVPPDLCDRLEALASLPADQRTDETAAEFARLLHQAARALRADDTPTEPRTDADHLAMARRLEQRIAA